jgi:transcriptional regulator of met regulon
VARHGKGIEEFKRFIIEHPLEFVKITAKRISIFFSLARPTGFWPNFTPKQQAASASLSLLFSVLIFPLGIAGAAIFFKKTDIEERRKRLFFLAMAVSIPISVIFILVENRYRYPLYPFLAIWGGFFVSEILADAKKMKFLAISFSLFLVNGIFDFILNFEKFWDKIKNILH